MIPPEARQFIGVAGFNTLWAMEHCKPSLLLIYGERGDISPDVKTDRMLRIGDAKSPIRSIWNTKRGPPFLMEVIFLEGGMAYFILPLITPRLPTRDSRLFCQTSSVHDESTDNGQILKSPVNEPSIRRFPTSSIS